MRLRLLLLTFLFSAFSWGQIVIDNTATGVSIPTGWSGANNVTTQAIQQGGYYLAQSTTAPLNDYLYSNVYSTINGAASVTIDVDIATYGSGTNSPLYVDMSLNGGSTWTSTQVTAGTPTSSTYISTSVTFAGPISSSNVQFRFYDGVLGDKGVRIKNIVINAFLSLPTITITPTTLTGFTYIVGSGPSAEQTFTASGTNLTTNITITAPTNYEISTASGAGFTNNITLSQSGGNVATTTIYARLKAALAIGAYNGQVIALTSTGATTKNVTCNGDVTAVGTAFSPGDFAVIALNSNITCYPAGPNGVYSAGDDEISFITFRDIQNGDSFHLTDNGYERDTAGLWGDTEGLYKFTRTGGTITAGTVITFRLLGSSPFVEFTSPIGGWSFVKETGFTGEVVMNTNGDQIFFTQGGTWNNPAGSQDATYAPGTYLYAFNTNSGWNALGGNTKNSALPLDLRCFSLMPGSATDYLEYTGPITAAAKLDWIARLNNPTNWTDRTNCAGFTRMHDSQVYSVLAGGSFIDGVWTGAKNTDWFDCANWQTLEVPDETINVDFNSTNAIRDAIVDATSPNATLYGSIAKSKDLTITSNKVKMEGNVNNKLEVHGSLLIGGTGGLDMDDSNPITADGELRLYGNWTNNVGNAAFEEGNGTVIFEGTTPQIINNVTPVGTEEFYNLILNNDFDTNVSNNIIALGNLTNNVTKTLVINTGDFAQVNKMVTNNGTFTVENNGSLVQKEDGFTNVGNISYKRTVSMRLQDYVYWSSPVSGFTVGNISTGTPAFYNFKWNPTIANTNGGWGNWTAAASDVMSAGKGYVVRGPNTFNNVSAQNFNATFGNGVPNNGIVTVPISRANNEGADVVGPNGTTITRFDDNWNLVGNPYPSSIDVAAFLALNTNIEGAVRIWTHGNLPNVAISDPFYQDFVANYTPNDYITYNGVGTVTGPAGFNGYIAGGQSFLVNMLDGVAATENVQFNNSLRDKLYDNSQFYRGSKELKNRLEIKNRIWLDIVNSSNVSDRTLIGYVEGATNEKDRMFDAIVGVSGVMRIYSIIDEDKMTIQGRSLPFTSEDKVKIGFFAPNNGLYSIAISAVDGLFSDNQDIFIEDKKLNLIHNLKQGVYSFSSESGQFNDRFVLRYTDRVLSEENFNQINNDVIVFTNEKIQIVSSKDKIKSIVIYDVLGRVLYSRNNLFVNLVNVSEILSTSNALVVKVKLENDAEIVKKIVF